MELLDINDFDCVGDIAASCNVKKLCIAEKQAIQFDLSELFCEDWQEVYDIWLEVITYQSNTQLPMPEDYEKKRQLIDGGFYTTCRGKRVSFIGLKSVLAFYSYSRYIMINPYTDTPNGLVTKTQNESEPINGSIMKNKSEQYSTMAFLSFKKIKSFLCSSQVIDYYDCGACGCGNDCKGSTKAKAAGGMIFTNIIKR